jgi:hypothetical protein
MERINGQVTTLAKAITMLSAVFRAPIPPLLSRPALFLTGHISSSVYLLEHAVWAFTANETRHEIDAEVFMRWVEEGGLVDVMEEVKRARNFGKDRIRRDKNIVFESGRNVKL